jgi:hypothetical protein
MSNHDNIHKLVHAIKALNQAETVVTQATAIDGIRWAKKLCWDVGEDLGVDISEQLKQVNAGC